MESISLTTLAKELIAHAQQAGSGRSARSIHGGHDRALRQTVLALAAGCQLAEHDSPGEATLQVLHGRVRLIAGDDAWQGAVGDYVTIPPERHSLAALEDAAVLLTVTTPR
jgi:quercetin dioxygenase-like cupin family protein